MIKGFEVCDPDDFLRWELNTESLEENYPEPYQDPEIDVKTVPYYELVELIDSDQQPRDLWIEKDCVLIELNDGTIQNITNQSIFQWYQYTGEDGWAILGRSGFACFILSNAGGQAGGLGIWCCREKKWIFGDIDEKLCVEAILYLDQSDVFVGVCSWCYPLGNQGDDLFIIGTDRTFRKIPLHTMPDAEKEIPELKLSSRFVNNSESFLGATDDESYIYCQIGNNTKIIRL